MTEIIDTTLLESLHELMMMIDAVETQTRTLIIEDTVKKETGNTMCGATEAYRPEFPALVEVTQRVLEQLSAFCETQIPMLKNAIETFEHHKVTAIANCEYEDCNERDEARRELGWNGENRNLL